MEFITAEQFKEQPKEVQKVFLEWWKCKKHDLYTSDGFHTYLVGIEEKGLICPNISSMVWHEKEKCIPLFTEGQLRKFIENKGYKIVKIELINGQYDIYTEYKTMDNYSDIWLCDELGENLLQAYWKVACSISKEEV